jgi:hypothetical protein
MMTEMMMNNKKKTLEMMKMTTMKMIMKTMMMKMIMTTILIKMMQVTC